jgi:hypothetical protein
VLKLRPWRCHACKSRFHAWIVPAPLVWFVHCPRCGLFNVERIGSKHVNSGTLYRLKRYLGFSAYRCDPCRTRFFSMRPYRDIHPLGSTERRRAHELVTVERTHS